MDIAMLNKFLAWARDTEAALPPGVHAELTVGEKSANSAARLDVDTSSASGRVTCWESGTFHAEVLDLDTGKDLFSVSGAFCSPETLATQLQEFLAILGVTPRK
jgi:hypothetical protein